MRFRERPEFLDLIGAYLAGVAMEATSRGYRFDREKVERWIEPEPRLVVTDGQLGYEWANLGAKLERRSPDDAARWRAADPAPHPLFHVEPGPIGTWERGAPTAGGS